MAQRIDRDLGRFHKIVKGRVRKELKKLIGRGEMIGRKGRDLVSIPIPQIEIPHIVYGPNRPHVGQGVGKNDPAVGDPIGSDPNGGNGGAGNLPGRHILEVDLTMDELAEIFGKELKLPELKPKGKKNLTTETDRYTGIRRVGPSGMTQKKRSFREALQRTVLSNPNEEELDPADTPVVISRLDKRFRSWNVYQDKRGAAVIFFMMDISGSMGDEQVDIVRSECFWIDVWLRHHFKGIEVRYIMHDAVAYEVDRGTFFHTRVSGGTKISSAYELFWIKVKELYKPEEWNIFGFHFSDGDNWSGEGQDDEKCLKLLRDHILPACNIFGYVQVHSPYGSGAFIKTLRDNIKDNPVMKIAEVKDKDAIYASLKELFG